MTWVMFVTGVMLAVLAAAACDAVGAPTLVRGLLFGLIIGLTVLLVGKRVRRDL